MPVHLLEACTCSLQHMLATTPGGSVDQPAWIYFLSDLLPFVYHALLCYASMTFEAAHSSGQTPPMKQVRSSC